jgi:hypothetical protein
VKGGAVCERGLDTVGVDARDDVECAGAQRFEDRGVVAVAVFLDKGMQDVQGRNSACNFGGMDVCINPLGRLCIVSSGGCISHCSQNYIPAEEQFAIRLEGYNGVGFSFSSRSSHPFISSYLRNRSKSYRLSDAAIIFVMGILLSFGKKGQAAFIRRFLI